MIRASWRITLAVDNELRPYWREVAIWAEADRICARLNNIVGYPVAFVTSISKVNASVLHKTLSAMPAVRV